VSRVRSVSGLSSVSRWVASWIQSINDKVYKVENDGVSRYSIGGGGGEGFKRDLLVSKETYYRGKRGRSIKIS
jgi:hypothetical protein